MRITHLVEGKSLVALPVGFGDASLTDFIALDTNDKLFHQAWGTVEAQLGGEDPTPAKIAMAGAYNQLASVTGNNLSPEQIASHSAGYAIAARTVGGAIATVQGLIEAGKAGGPTPADVANAFTGVLVGALVASGVATAGVGAAIIAGVAVVASALNGIFGGSSGGQQAPGWDDNTQSGCPGQQTFTCDASFFVSCVCVKCDAVGDVNACKPSPGSRNWRRFPNAQDPADAAWFTDGPESISWKGAWWYPSFGHGRLVDFAFPTFHYFDCDGTTSPFTNAAWQLPELRDFAHAFYAAWKANKEIALNGYVPRPDSEVFAQCVQLWNRARLSSTTVEVKQADPPDLFPNPSRILNAGCPQGHLVVPYFQTLVASAKSLPGVQDFITPAGGILIHTGQLPPNVVKLTKKCPDGSSVSVLTPCGGKGSGSSSKSSTVANVAVGTIVVGGLAAAGTAVYAHVTGQTFTGVLKKAWSHIPLPHGHGKRKKNPVTRREEEEYERMLAKHDKEQGVVPLWPFALFGAGAVTYIIVRTAKS